jgi:hypothetical protein
MRLSTTTMTFLVLGTLFSATPVCLGASYSITRYYVSAARTSSGDGLSWGSAFSHLQEALLASRPTSITEVWVAAGTYRPDEGSLDINQTFAMSSGFQLYGGFVGFETDLSQRNLSNNTSVLCGDLLGNDGPDFAGRADNTRHVITAFAVDATGVLDGFHVRGGYAFGPGYDDQRGGGALVEGGAPLFRNCAFEDNAAQAYGGGLLARLDTTLVVEDCTFARNEAGIGGGGLHLFTCAGTVRRCRFEENEADMGGGVRAHICNARLEDSDFVGNRARVDGGGVFNKGEPSPTAINCLFLSNEALDDGGAIRNLDSSPVFANCRILGNRATGATPWSAIGGVFNWNSRPLMINCVFSGNTSDKAPAALSDEGGSGSHLIHCTVANNAAAEGVGGILSSNSTTVIDNSIVQGNSGGEVGVVQGQPPQVQASIVSGYGGKNGNLDGGASFILALGKDALPGTEDDNLALHSSSPGVDAGWNELLPADTLDLDQDGDLVEKLPIDHLHGPRQFDDPYAVNSGTGSVPLADMGAFEAGPWLDLGSPTAGLGGTPTLHGDGNPQPGGEVAVHLSCVRPNSPTIVVVGLNRWDLALLGGTLVPSLDFLSGPFNTDAQGDLLLQHSLSAATSGLTLILQAWTADPSSPSGYSASNGLAVVVE